MMEVPWGLFNFSQTYETGPALAKAPNQGNSPGFVLCAI